jgi:prepilin-type N-terminal cleavage/methylation domain-containing protein
VRTSGRAGFTILELLVVLSIIAVIIATAIAAVMHTKVVANEATAISSLRTIHDAEEAFRATCGDGRFFASTLPQLGAAHTVTYDLADAPIVSKSGYLVTLVGTPPAADSDKDRRDACTGQPVADHWYATATPQFPGKTGRRGFATARDQDIWADTKGVPPPEPFQAGETISRLEIVK